MAIGYMRDHGFMPARGPGRLGSGDDPIPSTSPPFGLVIEYSTAVEKVAANYQASAPEDRIWADQRIDQWGISDKDFVANGNQPPVDQLAGV